MSGSARLDSDEELLPLESIDEEALSEKKEEAFRINSP